MPAGESNLVDDLPRALARIDAYVHLASGVTLIALEVLVERASPVDPVTVILDAVVRHGNENVHVSASRPLPIVLHQVRLSCECLPVPLVVVDAPDCGRHNERRLDRSHAVECLAHHSTHQIRPILFPLSGILIGIFSKFSAARGVPGPVVTWIPNSVEVNSVHIVTSRNVSGDTSKPASHFGV